MKKVNLLSGLTAAMMSISTIFSSVDMAFAEMVNGFEINDGVLTGQYRMETAVIPKGVTSIGKQAFDLCDILTSVILPDSVTNIESMAFRRCTKLNNIVLSDNLISIGEEAFSGCDSLTEIHFPDSLTSISRWAFSDCDNLTEVNLPAGVTDIKGNSFGMCDKLKTINVSPENTAYASVNGCLYSKDLKTLVACPAGKSEVTILDGVTSIGEEAFSGCHNLTNIVLPDSVTNISSNAFFCNNLTEITLPGSVTKVNERAFSYCKELKTINVSPENSTYTSVDGCLYTKDLKTLVACPVGKSEAEILDSVTNIEVSAFSNCSNLTSLTLSDNITSIGVGAFYGCDNLTISCKRESYALKYAQENNLKYEIIGEQPDDNTDNGSNTGDGNNTDNSGNTGSGSDVNNGSNISDESNTGDSGNGSSTSGGGGTDNNTSGGNQGSADSSKDTQPKTGDNTLIFTYLLAGMSAVSVICIVKRKKA